MTNISLHIEQLLHRHDCVILPSIGAFIASYKSAYINEEWGILTPPKREIYFNSSITNNDGLLANSIARKNRISFEAANIILQQEIEKIRSIIEKDKEYAIGKIGILHCGNEGNLDFERFRNDTQLNAFYGLCQFKMRTIAELEKSNNNFDIDTRQHRDQTNDKNYYIPINKQFAQYAVMFIVVLFAAISLSVPNDQYVSNHQEFASVVPIKKVITKTQKQTSQIIAETQSDTTLLSPKASVSSTIANNIPEVNKQTYYAVVATMRSLSEAEKFVRLKNTDKKLHIITIGKKSRVYTDCGSKEEMSKIITNPEFQNEFPGAWIWQPQK